MLVGRGTPKKGFALETSSHKCMGCQKIMPLNQSTLLPAIIDLCNYGGYTPVIPFMGNPSILVYEISIKGD